MSLEALSIMLGEALLEEGLQDWEHNPLELG